MFTVIHAKRFEKSFALCAKRGYDLEAFENVAKLLAYGIPLPRNNRDHKLQGDLVHCRCCHIKFDWVLIYRYERQTIIFEDTGTHSDLFR